MDQSALMKGLNWAYDQATAGIPGVGLEPAVALAENYRRGVASPDQAARRLIRWQVTKAGTTGFVTGIGGILLLPVTMPVNVAGVLIVQLQMIAAVAHLGGHDVHSDEVRTMAFACMCGNGAAGVLKDAGIQIGTKLTQQAIRKLSGEAIKKINQMVGFRLITKFGEKGVVNLGKMIPFVGAVVGGGFDATSTFTMGTVARRMFISGDAGDLQVPGAPVIETAAASAP